MTSTVVVSLLLAATASPPDGAAYAVVSGKRVSLFSEQDAATPVAKVEDRVVTLGELSTALAAVHRTHHDGDKAGKKDFRPVLDRLIGAQLVALEAHEMGIDELPQVKAAVEKFEKEAIRDVLADQLTRDAVADPAAVETYFRDAVREWKLTSLLFASEADAKQMSAALKAGKSFEALAAEAEARKKAQRTSADGFVALKALQPQVAAAVQPLANAGQISDPVHVQEGWAVIKVEDVRYPDDAAARAQAEARALDEAREKLISSRYAAYVKQYAKIDQKLLRSLDFEAKNPGFAKLEKDKRVLARIENGRTITVSDLAQLLRTNFFHGVEEAVRLKRVNSFAYGTFNKMLYREIFDSVAAKEKIAESSEYKARVAHYRDGIVFSEFVRRAVMPDVKVSEEDGKKYYEAHKTEFTSSALYTLDCLSFTSARAAQGAVDRLKSGTDFKWLKTNADGLVPEDDRNLDLGNGTVSARSLPVDLSARLANAKPNDLRIYPQGGQHHLLVVKQITPPKERPYLEVRAEIGKKLSGEKLNQALQDFIAKLRKAHDVKVYLTQIGS